MFSKWRKRMTSSSSAVDGMDVITSSTSRRWNPTSKRWRPQFERLAQFDDCELVKFGKIIFGENKEFLIGTGGKGTEVYLGLADDGTEVAVKKVTIRNLAALKNERTILQKLNDPSIVKYVDYAEDKNCGYLALELCEYTLEEYMLINIPSERERKQLAKQVLQSLNVLHCQNPTILHCDIKPQNVFIDIQGRARLADFGISLELKEGSGSIRTSPAGTRCWMARETLVADSVFYQSRTDIQVAGMLIYYILSGGHHPFGSDIRCPVNIYDGIYSLDHIQDEDAKNLIECMINGDPERRPTVEECLVHHFWSKETLPRLEEILSGDSAGKQEDKAAELKPLMDSLNLTAASPKRKLNDVNQQMRAKERKLQSSHEELKKTMQEYTQLAQEICDLKTLLETPRNASALETRINMEATDIITQNKIKLQLILMPNIHFASECVIEEKLVTGREYADLKSISPPSKAASELVDKMIFKGETTCVSFLRLLQDTKLTDEFPALKTMPWYNPPSTQSSEEEVKVLSCEHPEKDKGFCEEEQRAVCRICDSSHHPGHKLLPIEQAVNNLKDQLKSDLRTLRDKRTKCKHFKTRYNNEVVPHNKKLVVRAEKQIRAEFKKLHQILRDEEEARLAALREEEEQKEEIIQIIQEQISSLSDSISAVERDLQKHSMSFLSSYKHTQTRARIQFTLSDPQPDLGALIDVTKHLGNLTSTVWEKMKEKVTFTPVILDPNTAAPWLCLSEDLTCVRWTDTEQQLPDNPERFTNAANVLGSEGYSSGKHSWEVLVGDHPDWTIGVAKESVDRKGEKYVTPEYGIWCLLQKDGCYTNGCSNTIRLQRNPERIRVQLDYDRGEVSFYDPEDMTHIYTHKDTFTDKLYPYFAIGRAGDAETTVIKICPVETCLSGM